VTFTKANTRRGTVSVCRDVKTHGSPKSLSSVISTRFLAETRRFHHSLVQLLPWRLRRSRLEITSWPAKPQRPGITGPRPKTSSSPRTALIRDCLFRDLEDSGFASSTTSRAPRSLLVGDIRLPAGKSPPRGWVRIIVFQKARRSVSPSAQGLVAGINSTCGIRDPADKRVAHQFTLIDFSILSGRPRPSSISDRILPAKKRAPQWAARARHQTRAQAVLAGVLGGGPCGDECFLIQGGGAGECVAAGRRFLGTHHDPRLRRRSLFCCRLGFF